MTPQVSELSKIHPNNLTTGYTDWTWQADGLCKPFLGTYRGFRANLHLPELFDTR